MTDQPGRDSHPAETERERTEGPGPLSRRRLLNVAAAAGVGTLALSRRASASRQKPSSYGQAVQPQKPGRILGANERIRMGIIGAGGMGRHHVRSMLENNKDVEFIAICDIYEANRNATAKSASDRGSTNLKLFNEHEKLLDMKEVDGLVLAAPDHWHERHLIDTVMAGKDAYSEKPMSWSIDQGANMVRQVRRTDRIVQIGMQRRSTTSIIEAKKIVDSGFLGDVSLVRAQWYWNLPDLPKTFVPDGKLDWARFQAPLPEEKRYPLTPESGVKYQNWRYFWEYSGGNMTDQGTHLVDVIQWFMNNSKPPLAAQEHGAAYQIKGYETPDTFCTVLEYPKFMATWTLTYTNAWHNGWEIIFHGRKGTLELDNSGARFYAEGEKGFPWNWREKPPEPVHMVPGNLRVDLHETNFFDCMRTRRQPNCPVEIGHQAVSALHLANTAHHAKKRAVLEPDGLTIRIP